MKTAIVVDSSCGLTQEEALRNGWFFLPLYFIIDKKEYADGIDINSNELFKILKPDSEASTSATPVGEAIKLVEELEKEYDRIVIYPISAPLSSQYNNLKATLEENHPKVRVVHSNKVSVLILFDLIKFEENIANGMDFEKAVQEMEKPSEGKFLLVPKFNDALVRGGRLTPAAATVAKLLKIVPVIKFENGALLKEGTGRMFRKVLSKYFKNVCEEYPNSNCFIIHSENKEIDNIVEEFEEISERKVFTFPIPAIIAIHTGIEAVAFTSLDVSKEQISKIIEML